jgi:two-component system sensor histidine kinase AlgZ
MMLAGLFWRAKARTPAATAARLAELQSRIRPHFLFNTLNSAIALVRAEPAKAEAVLEDLSELFRHALADPAESVTLGQEIALAQRYLAIEQMRFGERLQVQWSLDPKRTWPSCRRCCCSRWWKTPSSTAWSPAPAARS